MPLSSARLAAYLLAFSLFACSDPNSTTSQRTDRPNVIIIFTDDQGSVDMGAYGTTDIQTPNMDALAARSVRFTQFYAGAPVCSPSRACLLTGKTPLRAGVPGNVGASAAAGRGLPPEEVTIAEMLKKAGYQTALIGKWHLGYSEEMQPNAQGFDYHFGHLVGCIDNFSHFYYWGGPNRHDLFRNGEEIHLPGQYFPDLMLDEASQFMETHRDDPFFIYYALNTPHYPYQGDPEWLQYYEQQGTPYPRNLYNAFVSTMDDRIGRLLRKVDDLGLRENTIVIFQSDHGHSTEERAHFGGGSAGPYRGAKFSLFEGGLRVPAMISWPGRIGEGEVREQLAVATDWLPTIAELCSVEVVNEDIDGRSLTPILTSASAPDNHEAFHWTNGNRWAVRQGSWKLLFDPQDTTNGPPKEPNSEEDKLFLVNLDEDIGEQNNVAAQHPEIVEALLVLHEEWIARK